VVVVVDIVLLQTQLKWTADQVAATAELKAAEAD
jgi:hypothetical protein